MYQIPYQKIMCILYHPKSSMVKYWTCSLFVNDLLCRIVKPKPKRSVLCDSRWIRVPEVSMPKSHACDRRSAQKRAATATRNKLSGMHGFFSLFVRNSLDSVVVLCIFNCLIYYYNFFIYIFF